MKKLLPLSLILVRNAKPIACKSQLLMYTLINKTTFRLVAFSLLICCFASIQLKAQKYTDKDLIGTWETTMKKNGSNCKMTYVFDIGTSFTSVDCNDGTPIIHFTGEWKYYADVEVLYQIFDKQDYKGQIKWINRDSMIYINFENPLGLAEKNYYKRIRQGIGKELNDTRKKEYFNAKWKRCTQNEASFYRLITYSAPNVPIGLVNDYYMNGILQSKFKANYIDPQDETKNKYLGDVLYYDEQGKYLQKVHYSADSKLEYTIQCDKNQVESLIYVKNPDPNDELNYHYFVMYPEKYPGGIIDELNISDMVAEKLKEKGFEQISYPFSTPGENNENICKTLFVFPHHYWNIGDSDELTVTMKNCEGKEIFSERVAAISITHQAEARRLVTKVSKYFSSIPASMKMPYFVRELNPSAPTQPTISSTKKASVSSTEIEYHDCTNCSASGKVKCNLCYGDGKTMCYSCTGLGKVSKVVSKRVQYYDSYRKSYDYRYESVYEYENCSSCSGLGKKRCNNCSESGKINCNRCLGSGKDSHIGTKKIIQD